MLPAKNEVHSNGHQLPLAERATNWKTVGDYQAAEPIKMTLFTKVIVFADLLLGTVQFILLSVVCIVKGLLRLIIPTTPKNIRGQLALVTGGGNGLGRALSLELARCGARVAIADVDTRAAAATARELRELYGRDDAARAYTADVSSPQSVRDLYRQVNAEWDAPVSLLVNNAGVIAPVSLLNGSDDDIDRIIDINLKSHFWMLRTFLPGMISAGGGHVVSICSMAGRVALSRACAYTATKFGVHGLSEALRAELLDSGADGVHLTVAYPYFLTTRKELIDNIELRIPPIHPDDAARSIVDAARRNLLQVGVPAHMPYITDFLSIMPHEVGELFRKTFKTELKP